jgi:hypothetical protein
MWSQHLQSGLESRHCGVPVVPARPWSDGLDRVEAALREI